MEQIHVSNLLATVLSNTATYVSYILLKWMSGNSLFVIAIASKLTPCSHLVTSCQHLEWKEMPVHDTQIYIPLFTAIINACLLAVFNSANAICCQSENLRLKNYERKHDKCPIYRSL